MVLILMRLLEDIIEGNWGRVWVCLTNSSYLRSLPSWSRFLMKSWRTIFAWESYWARVNFWVLWGTLTFLKISNLPFLCVCIGLFAIGLSDLTFLSFMGEDCFGCSIGQMISQTGFGDTGFDDIWIFYILVFQLIFYEAYASYSHSSFHLYCSRRVLY